MQRAAFNLATASESAAPPHGLPAPGLHPPALQGAGLGPAVINSPGSGAGPMAAAAGAGGVDPNLLAQLLLLSAQGGN
ncbi:hypothetical protein GPECTOR_4g720 [Gonium pectorale]|uniref:Uncharacterized protein n=1 Tax=Gonium pectorale TaxID=33097 RepID=A0A150GXY8_GONPE|nr:hypothetical protein GPECTOR_4g720 [Gonium pectorale]|eukprot:KXZ54654.1 hypothetical protein GPECTOR_4g720 [Gonium pectorale]